MSSSVTQQSSVVGQSVVSVKQQVIDDLRMSGLAPQTQQLYLDIILRFVRRTRLRPQDASEAQVAGYLRMQIERGLSRGTILPTKCALQFIFHNTLRREWDLFKKESTPRAASVYRWRPATSSAAA
jgi:hypothetical protein